MIIEINLILQILLLFETNYHTIKNFINSTKKKQLIIFCVIYFIASYLMIFHISFRYFLHIIIFTVTNNYHTYKQVPFLLFKTLYKRNQILGGFGRSF